MMPWPILLQSLTNVFWNPSHPINQSPQQKNRICSLVLYSETQGIDEKCGYCPPHFDGTEGIVHPPPLYFA
ncbi:Biotin synthase [Gossypium arboreum]|uniref:Biotin synthase n=1 Tax=Gossypium arboreum TaxID=29729 RepID=A0A0B0MQ06_GOSAR|nr:Biotin synthase [Gossypium arboreum]